ncbi:MAG TPA: hypothetical protein PK760_06915, partial [Flavobacteriales bacterium]|nr:hypothetical protein [Flavobacteriales bacterium]
MNESNGYEALIDPEGFTFRSLNQSDAWSLRFDVRGTPNAGGAWHARSECLNGDLIQHGDGIDVQYQHSINGLRQNFIVNSRPANAGGLRIDIGYSGGLVARRVRSGGFEFIDAQGSARATFSDLHVWDDCGKTLTAYFVEDPYCEGHIAIAVDDADAHYPITIDPVAATATTSVSTTLASAEFGRAVTSCGDLNGD